MASNAYNLLVSSSDDIIGFVAYSLYKESKMKFIDNYKARHNQEPTDTEITNFLLTTLEQENITRLRQQALGVVSKVLDEVASNQIQDAIKRIESQQLQAVEECIKRYNSPWWRDMFIGVGASFLFALFLTLVQMILRYNGGDLFRLFRS